MDRIRQNAVSILLGGSGLLSGIIGMVAGPIWGTVFGSVFLIIAAFALLTRPAKSWIFNQFGNALRD